MKLNDFQESTSSIVWGKPRRCEVTKRVPTNKGTEDAPKTEWVPDAIGKGYCYGGNVSSNLWLVELDSGQGINCHFSEIKFIQE